MSDNKVKLASQLPDTDELNSLNEAWRGLVNNPDDLLVAVVVLGVKTLAKDVETSHVTPTLRVRRVELIHDHSDKARLGDLATRAFERRTGKTVLPLDLEDEVREAFGAASGDEDAA